MKVDMLETNEDGGQTTLGSFILQDSKIIIEGDKKSFLSFLIEQGIWNRTTEEPEVLTLKDGELFLKNLKYNFTGSRLRATDILK